jgi:hypothetical protein
MTRGPRLFIAVLAFAAFSACLKLAYGGINWKAVWIEPYNPIALSPGTTQAYTVKGLNGANLTADLTSSPYLKVISYDPDIVQVDREHALLIGKGVGETELRISFSEATSLVRVYVRDH